MCYSLNVALTVSLNPDSDLEIKLSRMPLYVLPSNNELRAAEISDFSGQRAQACRPKELVPGILDVLGLLPVEGVVVLIHRPIVDLQPQRLIMFRLLQTVV